ncbi:MAG: hypothetical protein ACYCSO_02875 [Cuniculiplasma sp.]
MKITNKSIGITAILIVILFLGTAVQPSAVEIQNIKAMPNTSVNEKIVRDVKVHKNAFIIERQIIIRNGFVQIGKISVNITAHMSVHYTYYESPFGNREDFAVKGTTYFYGMVILSTFASYVNNIVTIVSLQSNTFRGVNPSNMQTKPVHTDNINPEQILCWTDETGSNGAWILSFNEMNTKRLIEYITIGSMTFGAIVKAAGPALAAALDVSITFLTHVFAVVFTAMVITAAVIALVDALGGYQGIYFGIGEDHVNLWFSSFNVPYPLFNSNPASGFTSVGTGSI